MPKKSGVPNKRKMKITKEKITQFKKAFDIFDRHKNGIMSFKDYITMSKVYYPITENKLIKCVKEIDEYKDGNMNFEGFVNFMRKVMEYAEKSDENINFKNVNEEKQKAYLGNKRKRTTTNNNKYQKKKNNKKNFDITYDNIIIIEEDEDKDNDDKFGSFYSDNTINIKKSKLNNSDSSKLFDTDEILDSYDKNDNNKINKDSLFDKYNKKKDSWKRQK